MFKNTATAALIVLNPLPPQSTTPLDDMRHSTVSIAVESMAASVKEQSTATPFSGQALPAEEVILEESFLAHQTDESLDPSREDRDLSLLTQRTTSVSEEGEFEEIVRGAGLRAEVSDAVAFLEEISAQNTTQNMHVLSAKS